MPSNSYDLLVLGDDLAALVCATLCARRGMRTLVLGDERAARYTLGPHKLPVEPAIWPIGPGSPADRVLKELHGELALRRKLREPRIAAQLVAPELRIDLGGDRVLAELTRELGAADAEPLIAQWQRAREIARLFDPLLASEHAFPAVGFFEKREVARIVETAGAAASAWWSELGDPPDPMWRGLAAILSRHPDPPPAAAARALDAWFTGPPALRGDGDAVRELLIEKLTTAGGEVRAGTVTDATVSWGKLASITLASGDEIGAGQVVASKTPAELVQLLGKKAPKRLSELAEAMAIAGYRYTLNVVLDEAGIPEHMAPTVAVLAAPGEAPVGDAAFSIHLGESDDAGRVVVTIAAILPSDGTLAPDRIAPALAALRAGLWRRLGEVMPFFERHLVFAHSPYEATPPQAPGGRGSHEVPKNLPLPPPPVWKGAVAQTADLVGAPYVTGLKNLTLTGDQILPSLGLEGALAAGWSAAKVACALAGKKKDYLRDEVVGAA